MTNTKDHVVNQMIKLLKNSPADEALFFEEEKNYKWLEYLIPHGFFKVEKIKKLVQDGNTYYYPAWPQGNYLESIAQGIKSKEITDEVFINRYAELLRTFYSVRENLWAIRSIFRSIFCIPTKFLSIDDVTASFNMIEEISSRNDYVEFDLHESYFNILQTTGNNEQERSIFKEYTKCLLRSKSEDRFGIRERKLIFFKDYRIKQFTDKFYQVQHTIKDYLLQDMISVVNDLLSEHLKGEKIDETSILWRPAIEPHAQNKFHDSAPSVFTGILYELSKTLLEKGIVPKEISEWQATDKFIFSRLFIALATIFPDIFSPNDSAKRIVELGLRYQFRHEMFHFLKTHFDHLSDENKDAILNKIEGLVDKYSDDNDDRKPLFTAWKKMRWLQAIKDSPYTRASNLYQEIFQITNSEAEHPDFDSYVGSTWVGPTSPLKLEDFDRLKAHEIVIKLAEFKDKKDRFGEPSVDGLSRVFEEYVVKEPVKCSALIKEMPKLPFVYLSAMFDGYTKCRVDNTKLVPDEELLDLALCTFQDEKFISEVNDHESKTRWLVTSIFRFISAGVREDKNAFNQRLNKKCYEILKKAVEIVKPSEDYKGSSDAQTRAINEPRGVLFESAILFALREARLVYDKKDKASKDSDQFKEAWLHLYDLIREPLESQNIKEVSLHAHLGSLYRQIQFLNQEWLYANIDLVCPTDPAKEDLWSAFMQGFCYVNVSVKEMYQILYQKGHLLKFLRYPQDSESKSSGRLDTLQERIIALALVSFVLKTESLSNGLLKEILEYEDADEWSRMIHFIPRIVGDKPSKSVSKQAKDLLSYITEKFDSIEDKMIWKKHFSSIGWVLPILKDPNDPLVEKIIKIEAFYTNDYWDHYEIVNYLEPLKDSHTETVGKLFLELVKSGKGFPGYPEEKIKAICASLKKNGFTTLLADVCKAYATKSPHSTITKAIFGIMEGA